MHISSLDFETSHVFKSSELQQSSFEKERPKYVRWVNHVLRSCTAPTIDVFKVEFKLDKIYGHIIDHWINFAFRKKVRRLEMNLSPYMQFPNPFFIVPDVNKSPSYFLSKPLGFSPCDSITILQLKYINVSGEVLEYFLSNCLFLEELCVVNSDSLVNIKVSGPSVQLKYLEICDCFHIKKLEISANSLVSFKYSGPEINLLLKDAPQLSEILIRGRYCEFLLYDCCHLSSYFCQIETLILGSYGVKVSMLFFLF